MNDEDLDYCEMCGETEDLCVCDLVVDLPEDFVWEYAFESITELKSKFMRILPPED